MKTLLIAVGLIWAGFGVVNFWGAFSPMINMDDAAREVQSHVAAFSLMASMLLFVIPGLIVAGIGSVIGGKK